MRHFQHLILATAFLAVGCSSAGDDTAGGMAQDTATAADSTTTVAFGESLDGDFEGPLGLQLWSVRDSMSQNVPGTLARVHDMGFREVELAGTYGLTPAEFRQQLDDAGLHASSMHVDYNLLRDSMSTIIANARTLGVQYVGTAWIPHPDDQPFSEELARQTATDFNRFGQELKDAGFQFFYHTHGYEFQPTPTGVIPFDVLMNATDPTTVEYEMDVFWVTRPGQDPAALLRKYPGRWRLMHLKGMKTGTPTNDFTGGAPAETEVPVGSGQIDYPGVLQAAQEIGVEKFYIEDESTAPLANIPTSVTFLRNVTF